MTQSKLASSKAQDEAPAGSRWEAVWRVCRTVLGVLLFAAAALLLGVSFSGGLDAGLLPDTSRGKAFQGVFSVTSSQHSLFSEYKPSEVEALLKAYEGQTLSRGVSRAGVLLSFSTLMLLGLLALWNRLGGERAMWAVVVAAMLVSALAIHLLPPLELLGWALAMLPAILVIHHGLYLGRTKPRLITRKTLKRYGIGRRARGEEDATASGMRHALGKRELASMKEMVDTNDRYFSTSNIVLRYGLPALAITAIGAVCFYSLNPVSPGALNVALVKEGRTWIQDGTLEAARLGALGAYVYVLLYLGQRGFRHDITSGAALWCAVTLALGPLMAATLSKVLATGLGTSTSTSTGWGSLALYFGVGMSPRHVAQLIAEQAQRIGKDSSKNVAEARSVPLAMVRGITPQVEERLHEEGIHDVVGLAMADPLRLQRNTNFDKYQILGWIDAALLAQALPVQWEELEKKGVRGARDLCWYVGSGATGSNGGLKSLEVGELPEPLLKDVALRLSQDLQVQRIQLLYQFVEDSQDTAPATAPMSSASDALAATVHSLPEATSGTPAGTGAAPAPAEALQASSGDGAPRTQA